MFKSFIALASLCLMLTGGLDLINVPLSPPTRFSETDFLKWLSQNLLFPFSNIFLDNIDKNKKNISRQNYNIRAFLFIAPAFIVFIIFILYPVLETLRLSFYDKYGRDFVGINNYLWAFKDPELRRGLC